MLVGMAVTFAVVATLAAVGGGWAVEANQYGRIAALALLALFGLTLLFPGLRRPADAAAGRRSARGCRSRPIATRRTRLRSCRRCCSASRPALLWAPCAGPVLGLILTGAALQGRERRDDAAAAGLCGWARRPRWRWRCSSAAGFSRR